MAPYRAILRYYCDSTSAQFGKCQKLQPPLLLKKVLQYTSSLYCNTPPICIAVLSVQLSSQEREILQYSPHLYCSTPPICILRCHPNAAIYPLGGTAFCRKTGKIGGDIWMASTHRRASSQNISCHSVSNTAPTMIMVTLLCGRVLNEGPLAVACQ